MSQPSDPPPAAAPEPGAPPGPVGAGSVGAGSVGGGPAPDGPPAAWPSVAGPPPGVSVTPYGWGAPPEHPQSTTVFVLGILGVVVPVVSFVAWYLGNQALRDASAAGPGAYRGLEQLRTGRLLGLVFSWVQIAGLGLTLLLMVPAVLVWVTFLAQLPR